ncbi:Txe/YoeB family addiction module toxin [Aquimarina agarivorans]|uniref:Txe/YoeB family addiction module toxin n=1 Tax=Aquimarina agarivorans TaxID=980584 RepID=UPI000248E9FE|nr:Txe/YoeB family addiction module toxin [Aquimarina agarivorans]
MRLIWSSASWEDYLYWQKVDKKIVKRINELIKSAKRTPFDGIGKPEALKGDLQGYWSRRITAEHRLVYKYEKDQLLIAGCRYHYGK